MITASAKRFYSSRFSRSQEAILPWTPTAAENDPWGGAGYSWLASWLSGNP